MGLNGVDRGTSGKIFYATYCFLRNQEWPKEVGHPGWWVVEDETEYANDGYRGKSQFREEMEDE